MKTVPMPPRPALSRSRARKDAAKMLGIALQTRYRKLLEASGEDEIVVATADLAQCMYENVEFVIWVLKSMGGLNPPLPEQLRKITPPKPKGFVPANDPERLKREMNGTFQKPPAIELPAELPECCTCPPLDHGIIGRDKHMTSCPLFVP